MPLGEQILSKAKELRNRSSSLRHPSEPLPNFSSVRYESVDSSVPPKAGLPGAGNQESPSALNNEQAAAAEIAAKRAPHKLDDHASQSNQSPSTHQLPIREGTIRPVASEESQGKSSNAQKQGNDDSTSGMTVLSSTNKPLPDIDPHLKDKLHYSASETVDVKKHIRKPVVHETVRRHTNYVQQDHITREIHTHDIYYRILPLIDVEVLPAKDYFHTASGEIVLMSKEETAELYMTYGGVASYTLVPKIVTEPAAETFQALKQFSARPIAPHERTLRRWVDENGVEQSSQYHFHRPVLLGATLAEDLDPDAVKDMEQFMEVPTDGRTEVVRTVNGGE